MNARLACIVAICAAPPVLAQCPTAGDLSTGIALTYENGEVERFRRIDDLRVEVLMPGETPPLRDVSAFGLYLLRSADWVAGAERDPLVVDYGIPAADLPRPAPDMSLTLRVEETYGGRATTMSETYVGGASFDHAIGDCTLTALDMKLVRKDGQGPDAIEVVRYFPDLGFGHVWAIGDAGSPLETFPVTRIEVMK